MDEFEDEIGLVIAIRTYSPSTRMWLRAVPPAPQRIARISLRPNPAITAHDWKRVGGTIQAPYQPH